MAKETSTNLIIRDINNVRHFIPVMSIKNIIVVIDTLLVHFNLVPEVWQECGCNEINLKMKTRYSITKLVEEYHKKGGRIAVHYVR